MANYKSGKLDDSQPLIRAHGGYRKLRSFQIAQLVYDVTVRFCEKFIDRRSRTCDQMVQAARSGVQNIAEGSQASGTSKKTKLKLTNVARASLEELRLDYEDFLRQRGYAIWSNDDPRRKELVSLRPQTVDDVAKWSKLVLDRKLASPDYQPTSVAPTAPSPDPKSIPSISSIESISSIAANATLVLIGVAVSLLDRQIRSQACEFEHDGGFTERLYQTRKTRRQNP